MSGTSGTAQSPALDNPVATPAAAQQNGPKSRATSARIRSNGPMRLRIAICVAFGPVTAEREAPLRGQAQFGTSDVPSEVSRFGIPER